MEQGAEMVDFAGVVEVVGDHDPDDGAGGHAVAPVGEAVAVQLGVVGQGADGGEPAAVAVGEPGEQLVART